MAALATVAVLVGGYIVWQAFGRSPGHAANGEPVAHGTPAPGESGGVAGVTESGSAAPSATTRTTPTRTAAPSRSAASPKPPSQSQAPLPTGLKTVKVMVLGDSISSGAKDEVMNGYRLELLKKLPGYPIDYVGTYKQGDSRLADKDMQAEGGACIKADPCNSTTMYPLTAGWIRATQPNVVIMQGGGNDYCCGNADQPDSVVIQAMTDWINLIWKTKPDISIIVIGMIDYHDDYKAWIPKYVAAQAKLGKHIAYVSYDGISTYDTVHPDITGYQQLAGRIAPVLKPTLDKLLGR